MLTLKRCREILGPRCMLSDRELEVLRDQLYAVAEVALDAFSAEPRHPEPEAASPDDEEGTC